jgi:GNAT superfamily N-acetyltransferase
MKPPVEARLLQASDQKQLDQLLKIYMKSFHPDERVGASILRRIIKPSPARVDPIHLYAAYCRGEMVGGALTAVFPAFRSSFGSYIFVDPSRRGEGLGAAMLKVLLPKEKSTACPTGQLWRMYGEVTPRSGSNWRRTLARAGFRFFASPWPVPSYHEDGKVTFGRLGYFSFLRTAPARFSQPAFLAYVYSRFYGPEAMHSLLLPRLRHFVAPSAPLEKHQDALQHSG